MTVCLQDLRLDTLQPSEPRNLKVRFVNVDPGGPEHGRTRGKSLSCFRCGSTTTATWRNGLNGERLCNKCGLREIRARKTGASGLLVDNEKTAPLPQRNIPGPQPLPQPTVREAGNRERSAPAMFWNPLEVGEVPEEGSAYHNPIVIPDLFQPESFCGEPHVHPTSQPSAFDEPCVFQAPSNQGSVPSHDGNPGTSSRVMIQRAPQNTSELFSWLYALQEMQPSLSDEQMSTLYDESEVADSLPLYGCAPEHRSQGYLHQTFSVADFTISNNPVSGYDYWFSQFHERTTQAHLAALQEGSSVYVAMETFIFDYAGGTWKLTAYAVLQKQYDGVHSPTIDIARHSSPWEAAQHDLEFGYVEEPTSGHPNQIVDWLHGQSLARQIKPLRAMSAIWDLTGLPVGTHHPLSATFRFLKRSFDTIDTSFGPQITPQIVSGNPNYNFRTVHQIMMTLKHVGSGVGRMEIFKNLEPKLREACIRSCQEWFIACLDEAARRGSFDFLWASKEYMRDTIVLFRRSFEKINVRDVPHICSFPCPAHVQPSFDELVSAAKHALDALFSEIGVMQYARSPMTPLLTQDQLFHAQTVGSVQYKLYFSYSLLNDEQRSLHSDITWRQLADERNNLVRRTQANLIWNYLPVDVARVVAPKLDCALALSGIDSTLILCS